MSRRRRLTAILIGLAAAAVAGAQSLPIPIGDEIDLRVSPDECGFVFPNLAFSGDGSLMVVWHDGYRGLVARSFEPGGSGPGELSILSTTPEGPANSPSIAGLVGDRFAVAWLEEWQAPYEERTLVLQVFDHQGTPLSEIFEVASHVSSFDLAADAHDRMLLAWTQNRDSEKELKIQPFGPFGPTSEPRVVDSSSTTLVDDRYDLIGWGLVTLFPQGSGLVVWTHSVYSSDSTHGNWLDETWISGAEVSADGSSVGPTVLVSPVDPDPKYYFRPQHVSPGRFLGAWTSPSIDADLFTRIWSPNWGWRPVVRHEVETLPYLMEIVSAPKIGAAWIELAMTQREESLELQRASKSGLPTGAKAPVSRPPCETLQGTPNCGLYHWMVHAAARDDGRIAVVWLVGRWSGIIPEDCDIGVTVRLRFLDTPVMQDDFETGDLGRWSAQVGGS